VQQHNLSAQSTIKETALNSASLSNCLAKYNLIKTFKKSNIYNLLSLRGKEILIESKLKK
jgi:hypothetical protein